jgi:catechol-2,3-dioxygenase
MEEFFLQVKDLDRAFEFYHRKPGIPLDQQDEKRVYLQCDRGPLALQIDNSTGRHQAGGPLCFAFTIPKNSFDRVVDPFAGSEVQTRGPMQRQEPFQGRTLFIFDPDGNGTAGNTRYLYDAPLR